MVLVNGNWYFVEDMNDVSKLIRENYNDELADKLDEIFEEEINELKGDKEELQIEIWDLKDEVSDLEDEITDLEFEIQNLESKIEELESEIV